MMIPKPHSYSGSAKQLFAILAADFLKYNGRALDKWEADYYLEELEQSIDSGQCWSMDQSIMAVNDDLLIYTAWKGAGQADFAFLMQVIAKYDDLRVVPLGKYFQDLTFLMNGVSMKKWHGGHGSTIRLDFHRYNTPGLQEYFNWAE